MSFSFHPEAEQEFDEAVKYYRKIDTTLGFDFAIAVREAIQRAVDMPKAWGKVNDEVRRSLVNRFPFAVLYVYEQEAVFILAVMHLRRSPDYWLHRI